MTELPIKLVIFVLLALLPRMHAGSVTAYNHCTFSVYCAIVKGCPAGELCPATFEELGAGQGLLTATGQWPDNVGMSIMCGRSPNPNAVSQVEWTSNDAENKLYFDLSNVKGAVFASEGMTMYVDEARTGALPTCYGAVCHAGEDPCPYIYNTDYEDKRGMRACTQNANIYWFMCFGDGNLALPAPGTGTM